MSDKEESAPFPDVRTPQLTDQAQSSFNAAHKQRAVFRTQLTKAINAALDFLSDGDKSDASSESAESFQIKIGMLRTNIQTLDDKLVPFVAEYHSDRLEKVMENVVAYQHAAEVALSNLRKFIERGDAGTSRAATRVHTSTSPSGSDTTASHQPTMLVSRAPKAADIPKFYGDVKKYRDWWQHFEFLVDSKPLPKTEKFRLLKLSLAGQAAAAIADLSLEEASYEIAKTTLKDRFGKVRDASAEHVMAIIRICNQLENPRNDKLNHFSSQVSLNVKALIALGSSYGKLSTTLFPIIFEAMPQPRREQFSLWVNDRKKEAVEVSDLEKILAFLDRIADAERQASAVGGSDPKSVKVGDKKPFARPSSKFPSYPSHSGRGQQRPNRPERFQGGRVRTGQISPIDSPSTSGQSDESHAFATSSSETKFSCVFCSENHPSFKCKKAFTIDERKVLISQNNACSKCLRRNHSADRCNSRIPKCPNCDKRHYLIMCDRPQGDSVTSQVNYASINDSSKLKRVEVLLTGHVEARSPVKSTIVRILVDPGSMRSYVSSGLVRKLDSKPSGSEWLRLLTIGGAISDIREYDIHKLSFKSRFSNASIETQLIELPEISKGTLPFVQNSFGLSPIADSSDPAFPREIDVVFGANAIPSLKQKIVHEFDDMVAVETIFRWFFNGLDAASESEEFSTSLLVLHSAQGCALSEVPATERGGEQATQIEEDIEFLWETELLGIDSVKEEKDIDSQLMQFFSETISRDSEGRYVVTLPFKENIDALGDNEKLARSCLSQFVRSNRNNKKLVAAVDKEIQDCINLGYAEAAPDRLPGEPAHYLPLLAVAKRSAIPKPDAPKIRVVKNAAARSRDQASLNDVLHSGPSLIPCIIQVLTFFRRHSIAIVTDVRKAFLQFQINPSQRTFLRFVWPIGISSNPSAPVREFWGKSLEFGLAPSPFLFCAGLRHHLNSEISKRPEDAGWLTEVRERFYIDDIFSGSSSVSEGRHRAQTLNRVFASGHLFLAKWGTNSPELGRFMREQFPEAAVAFDNREARMLGVLWDQSQDKLGVFTENALSQISKGAPTKKSVLRSLSQIFDPLGIISPVSIGFKILLQTLWSERRDWQEELSGENLEALIAARSRLEQAGSIRIDRFVSSPSNVIRRELHVFTDSSLMGYGAVIYLKEILASSQVKVTFLISKARVVPLKGSWNIHRLELISALLGVRLHSKIKQALSLDVDSSTFHCDNASVLGWVRGDINRWRVFVRNRIKEIHEFSNKEDWRYCPSEDNPADILSRGKPITEPEGLRFWTKGPHWLSWLEAVNFEHRLRSVPSEEAAEEMNTLSLTTVVSSGERIVTSERFSSWVKLVRVQAFAFRFIERARKPRRFDIPHITPEEFAKAEAFLFQEIQSGHFGNEIRAGLSNIHRSSVLFQLNPFKDERDLIRCRSRLERATELSYDQKYPIVLPGSDHTVFLYVNWVHSVLCVHSGGVNSILHHLRTKVLVLRARRVAKQVIKRCKVCLKFNAKRAAEVTPPLPDFRTEVRSAFSVVGIDFAGPIFVRDDSNQRSKSYICLFVCSTTRAVHLELVPDLSCYEFLMALRRFFNRFPFVSKIISDNALTFKRAEKEIGLIRSHIRSKETQALLSRFDIRWEFVTERAPNMNGWVERLVQTVKRPLRKVLGTNVPRYRELATTLTDVENMVNQRPLTFVPTDPHEPKALTPADLVYGCPVRVSLPSHSKSSSSPENSGAAIFQERWTSQQAVLDAFWRRYVKEYLQYLRSLHWSKPVESRPLKVGDLCILDDPKPSRAHWPLCRITALVGGRRTDLRNRSCFIRFANGKILRRPCSSLYPLEVN